MSRWIMKGLGRVPVLGAALLLYAMALGGATAWSYTQTRAALLAEIDHGLLLAAMSVRLILAGDFPDRARGPDAISRDEDWRNIRALSAFARRSGIACLLSAVEEVGQIRLTARSASPAELAAGAEAHYFTPYGEVRPQILQALHSAAAVTATYTDRWGTFRAVLVPEVGPQGRVYVAAAQLALSEVQGRLAQTLFQCLLTAALLLVAALPVLLQINRRLRVSEAELQRAVAARTRELQRLAALDPLTGLLNRRAFYDALGREVRRGTRYGGEFCLALLDLDWFKSVNDTYGHQTGDLVLQRVAAAIADGMRTLDTCARVGGEEFAILLPETPLDKAVLAAERVCARVHALTIVGPAGATISVTVSIGVASSSEAGMDMEGMVQIADERLYLAKTQGRDRVVALGGSQSVSPGERCL